MIVSAITAKHYHQQCLNNHLTHLLLLPFLIFLSVWLYIPHFLHSVNSYPRACLLTLFTYCTWRLCWWRVSNSAVVERCDPELVGNGGCQAPYCMTSDFWILDDVLVPDWGANPSLCLLLWIIAAASPSWLLWHPSVLQHETCPAAIFLCIIVYLPLELHLVTLSAAVCHSDQGCIGRHGVPWVREGQTERCACAKQSMWEHNR